MILAEKRLQQGLIVLVVALFFIFAFFLSSAEASTEKGKIVMVIVDRISLADLQENKLFTIKKIIQEGSLALMNTNSGAGRISSSSYLTIGAGNRAIAGEQGGLALNREEKYQNSTAGDFFQAITGYPSGQIVHLGFAQMVQACSSLKQTVIPGALGEELVKEKIKRAVLGNCDIQIAGDEQEYRRYAVSIAMDQKGGIDFGDVSSSLVLNKALPATDFLKLEREYHQLLSQAHFFVLETGDTSRLDQYAVYFLPTKIKLEKKAALQRIDHLLSAILPTLNKDKDLFLLVVPTPSKEQQITGNNLTPILAWGKNIEHGFLTSGTTHRLGLVTNLDLAPTIIHFYNGKVPVQMSGQVLYSQKAKNTVEKLSVLNEQIVNTANQHGIVLKAFVTCQIIFVLLALAVILFSSKVKYCYFILLQNILLGLAFVPWLLLVFPFWRTSSITITFLILIGIIFLIIFFLNKQSKNPIYLFFVLGILTSSSILLDILLGSPMMKTSLLGYDPMVGARFYGIGNEYSGVLLGSSILGSAAFLQYCPNRRNNFLVYGFFLLIVFVSASPQLGTDVGGTITSIVAFLIFVFHLKNKKITIVAFSKISLVLIILILLLISWDLFLGESTHIGRAASLIQREGWQAAQQIIERKLGTNLRLLRYTIWTKVLLTFLLALAILFFHPLGVIKQIVKQYSYLGTGFIGIAVASIVGLAVNDSGVVQAATTILYAACPLVYLVLDERRKKQ